MKLNRIVPFFIKRIIYKSIIKRRYDVKFGRYASADLNTIFEGKNLINDYSRISHSYLGLGTYISGYNSLSRVKIGRFCSIGQRLKTNLGVHPTTLISTHPCFYSAKKQAGFSFVKNTVFKEHRYIDKDCNYLIEIGHDVWIGNDVTILDGIKIGNGAIIATGAIVTKDVEPYCIVGGIPAKVLKMRFSEVEISKLLQFGWWNKDFDWLRRNNNLFLDKESFFTEVNRSI